MDLADFIIILLHLIEMQAVRWSNLYYMKTNITLYLRFHYEFTSEVSLPIHKILLYLFTQDSFLFLPQ